MTNILNVIQVGDIGTAFLITLTKNGTPIDISAATLKQVIIVRTDGTKLINDAIFETNGSNGVIAYISILDDLSVPGEYKIQAKVVLPTWSGNSTIGTFIVNDNL